MVPLLVVPTELTDYTEAYGFKLLESTEWPTLREAGTHGNEGYILQAIISVSSVSSVGTTSNIIRSLYEP
mgnify:CR=1 FL=1